MERILPTLAFTRFDTTIVLVLTTIAPSSHDWSAWTQAYTAAATEHGVRALFVVTDGGGPNAAQRKEVVESVFRALGAEEADTVRTAICSDSTMARFITAAMGWLYVIRNMELFGAEQQREALRYLGSERPEPIIAAIPLLQRELRRAAAKGR